MTRSNIKSLLKKSIISTGKSLISSDTQDPLYQKYEKNLYKQHRVPKMKFHQPRYR